MLESHPLPTPELISISQDALEPADVVVVGLTDDRRLSATLVELDRQGDGWISRLIEHETITGKAGEHRLLGTPLSGGPAILLVLGLGSVDKLDRQAAFESSATAMRMVCDRALGRVVMANSECFPPDSHDAIVAGSLFGCEGQGLYQSEPALHVPDTIAMVGVSDESLRRGRVIGESINQVRRLVNEPPAMLYPASFAEQAELIGKQVGVEVETWDQAKLESEGCRALLAVGGGSANPPRLVIMRYRGGGEEPPVALVGKGVTFDSGGLSLKPTEGMTTMKCDMAGAATVVGVMHAIASLGVKRNVVALCGLAENMVSGQSYKLGDVIETRSGKTIEILNTDAEGRVVLADVLDVALQQEPSEIVDLATLTGACMVALGTEVAGLMGNDQSLCDSVTAAAAAEGEPVWQLPMFDLYDEKVKSKVADIKNVGDGRWGGAITAAKFLENFVAERPWLHIDIAGPAFADSPKPFRDAGATGAMVRTLIRWLEAKAN